MIRNVPKRPESCSDIYLRIYRIQMYKFVVFNSVIYRRDKVRTDNLEVLLYLPFRA